MPSNDSTLHHTQKHAVNMINQSNIEDSNFVTSIESIEIPNVTDNFHETGVSLGEVGAINVTLVMLIVIPFLHMMWKML